VPVQVVGTVNHKETHQCLLDMWTDMLLKQCFVLVFAQVLLGDKQNLEQKPITVLVLPCKWQQHNRSTHLPYDIYSSPVATAVDVRPVQHPRGGHSVSHILHIVSPCFPGGDQPTHTHDGGGATHVGQGPTEKRQPQHEWVFSRRHIYSSYKSLYWALMGFVFFFSSCPQGGNYMPYKVTTEKEPHNMSFQGAIHATKRNQDRLATKFPLSTSGFCFSHPFISSRFEGENYMPYMFLQSHYWERRFCPFISICWDMPYMFLQSLLRKMFLSFYLQLLGYIITIVTQQNGLLSEWFLILVCCLEASVKEV